MVQKYFIFITFAKNSIYKWLPRLNLYVHIVCITDYYYYFVFRAGHMRACAVYSVYLFVCLLIITNSNSSTPNKNLISSTHCRRYKYRRDTNQDAKHTALQLRRESVAVCHHSRSPLHSMSATDLCSVLCVLRAQTNERFKYDRMNKCSKL